MSFVSKFSRSCMRRFPRAPTFSKRLLTDRSFRLATLDDLQVYHDNINNTHDTPDFIGYPARAVLTPRDMRNQMLVDLSHEQGFRRGHIPGAVNLPVDKFDFTRHVDSFDGIHQEDVVSVFKELGLTDKVSEIILYDNSGLLASRLWFVLRYFGFRNVRVLQGGWRNYLKSGCPIAEDTTERESSQNFTLKAKRTKLLTKPSQFFVDLNNVQSQMVDARRPDAFAEYHVPGSWNVPSSVFMDDATYHSVDQIRGSLAKIGLDVNKRTIVYSENSLSCCVALFGLKMIGLDRTTVYDLGIDNYRKVFDDSLSDDASEHLSR